MKRYIKSARQSTIDWEYIRKFSDPVFYSGDRFQSKHPDLLSEISGMSRAQIHCYLKLLDGDSIKSPRNYTKSDVRVAIEAMFNNNHCDPHDFRLDLGDRSCQFGYDAQDTLIDMGYRAEYRKYRGYHTEWILVGEK